MHKVEGDVAAPEGRIRDRGGKKGRMPLVSRNKKSA